MKLSVWKSATLFCLLAAGQAFADDEHETTYPTTVTKITKKTSTVKPKKVARKTDTTEAPAGPSEVAIMTVTTIEPWTRSPDHALFPYTMVQTVVTDRTDIAIDGATTHTIGSTTATVASTWMIWNTSPTDLPKGVALPPCEGGCAPRHFKQDPRCQERGLDTACHSQCKIRDVEGWHVWWCHQKTVNDTAEVNLGRVCSGSDTYYEQLMEPCASEDHRNTCPPCVDEL